MGIGNENLSKNIKMTRNNRIFIDIQSKLLYHTNIFLLDNKFVYERNIATERNLTNFCINYKICYSIYGFFFIRI